MQVAVLAQGYLYCFEAIFFGAYCFQTAILERNNYFFPGRDLP